MNSLSKKKYLASRENESCDLWQGFSTRLFSVRQTLTWKWFPLVRGEIFGTRVLHGTERWGSRSLLVCATPLTPSVCGGTGDSFAEFVCLCHGGDVIEMRQFWSDFCVNAQKWREKVVTLVSSTFRQMSKERDQDVFNEKISEKGPLEFGGERENGLKDQRERQAAQTPRSSCQMIQPASRGKSASQLNAFGGSSGQQRQRKNGYLQSVALDFKMLGAGPELGTFGYRVQPSNPRPRSRLMVATPCAPHPQTAAEHRTTFLSDFGPITDLLLFSVALRGQYNRPIRARVLFQDGSAWRSTVTSFLRRGIFDVQFSILMLIRRNRFERLWQRRDIYLSPCGLASWNPWF